MMAQAMHKGVQELKLTPSFDCTCPTNPLALSEASRLHPGTSCTLLTRSRKA
jgi:hypothetical protein